jgi:PPP family 3-phenylpropionic acid transporter
MVPVGFAPRLALLYAAIFALVGVQLPFFPLWLTAKGLDAQAIGIVLAVPAVVRLLAIPLASRQADRRDALRGTLVATTLLAAAGYAVLGVVDGFIAILAAFTLASLALTPVTPLTETYALRGLAARGRTYGPVRLWGSAAFVVGTFVAGFAADVLPARDLIWLIVAAAVFNAVAALMLEPLLLSAAAAPAPSAARPLLRDPAFVAVILAAGLIQASHAVYYGFSTLDWSRAGFGGMTVAALWALGVVAEIVLFAAQGRLPAALTPLALIGLGGAGALLRWLAMAFDPPAELLPLLQVLHALSFGATHLGALGYLARTVPHSRAAVAQGHFAVVLGLTMAGSMALSGVLYADFGARAYLAMALMAAAGGAGALIAHRLGKVTAL